MKIHLFTIGQKMDQWVDTAFTTYASRLSRDVVLQLHELPLAKRTKNSTPQQWKQQEATTISQQLLPRSHMVALEVTGSSWSTEQLAQRMEFWLENGQPVSMIIGGPDGIDSQLSQSCHEKWSLSPLTLPHPLVRIVVAEQLYRAWSINNNHPYHRQ